VRYVIADILTWFLWGAFIADLIGEYDAIISIHFVNRRPFIESDTF